MPEKEYTCEDCGGTFNEGWTDEEAHAEALRNFGRDGRDPSMAKVCDDCFKRIMKREGEA